jgi:hypothetical protein
MKKSVLVILALSLLLTACKDSKQSTQEQAKPTETSVTTSTSDSTATSTVTTAAPVTTTTETKVVPLMEFNSFDNVDFTGEPVLMQDKDIVLFEDCSVTDIVPVLYRDNCLYFCQIFGNPDEDCTMNLFKYDFDKQETENTVHIQFEDFYPNEVSSIVVGDELIMMGNAHGYRFCRGTDIVTGEGYDLEIEYNYPDMSFHYLFPLNDNQYVEYYFQDNSKENLYDIPYTIKKWTLSEYTTPNGRIQTEALGKIVSSSQSYGDPTSEEIVNLCGVDANNNGIYELNSQGTGFKNLSIREQNDTKEFGGDYFELNSLKEYMEEKPNQKGIDKFSVFGNFISISYTDGLKILLQKNGEDYDVEPVFD